MSSPTSSGITDDVVVIGGGLAGLTAATFLLRDSHFGVKVSVLEAGPRLAGCHLDSSHTAPTAFERWCYPHRDSFAECFTSSDGSWEHVMRRVLGGRGMYWGGVLCPINPLEFSGDALSLRWFSSCGLAGPNGLYSKVRSRLSQLGFLDENQAPVKSLGLFGLEELGFTFSSRAASKRGDALQVFSSVDFLSDVEPVWNSQLTVDTNSSVFRIQHTFNYWTVHYRKDSGTFVRRAKTLILASGGINNAKLYTSLRNTNAAYTITDHLVCGFIYVCDISESEDTVDEKWGQILLIADRSGLHGFNLFASVTRVRRDRVVLDVWAMGEKDTRSPGVLTVSHNADRFSADVTIHNSSADMEKLGEMRCHSDIAIKALLKDLGLHMPIDTPAIYAETRSAAATAYLQGGTKSAIYTYSSLYGSVDHEACIFLQGSDVTEIGECVKFPACYVLGPSVFPRMGSANPSFTSMALAAGVSERILQKL